MSRWKTALYLLLLALPLSAFAGKDEAQDALIAARASVSAADRADAPRYATNELNTARDMLARADGSFADHDWDDAEREAGRALVDGRLAEARSRQHATEQVLHELEATIQTLRTELGRKGE